ELDAWALETPWAERENRVEPIQGLDLGLLIQAKDGRMLRRIDVQADDVSGLSLECRIVGQHVALDPMGLDSGTSPHPVHQGMADAQILGQLPRAPMRGSILGGILRRGQD